jgi:hypothetical protein
MVCSPSQAPVNFLCKDQIPNAAIAYITRTCNQYGSGEVDSLCTLNSCNPGYFKVGNTCVVEGSGGGGGGGNPGTYDFAGVADLPAPSQTKMTCKDWLAENGINSVRPDQVRSIKKNRSNLAENAPRIARCAYIIKLTQNGNQQTYCQSRGWDISSFQGTYDTYDEIIPIASCNENNGSLYAIETSVYRLSSTIGPARATASTNSIAALVPTNSAPVPSQLVYTNVSDLPAPTKVKITCEDWLIENGINPPHQDEVRSIKYNLTSGNGDLPKFRTCAYLVTLTQNGVKKTRCESHGVDFMSFQGSFNLYDEIRPVSSCVETENTNNLIETNILRDPSKIGSFKLLVE